MSQPRRLAAILAADVAGYSRLMGADEEGTLERLKALRRELIDPKIAEHHGRIRFLLRIRPFLLFRNLQRHFGGYRRTAPAVQAVLLFRRHR